MNTEINEKISQLVDGELHSSKEEVVLRKIRKHPELNNKMNRYLAVGHALKTDNFIIPSQSFLEKINQEIKHDPHYFLPRKPQQTPPKNNIPKQRWKITSIAVAATIAIVAVIVTQKSALENTHFQQQEVLAISNQVLEMDDKITNKSQLSQHDRFKAYLQAHSDDLYTYGSLNYQPHARVATFGQE